MIRCSSLPRLLFVLAIAACANVHAQSAPARLMRYPDVSNGRIAFIWSNDIWIVAVDGGTARRLTADNNPKANLRFSPDGTAIGYTMTVAANADIHVVPVHGGISRRITHHPGYDHLVDWYPDGKSVLMASQMLSPRIFNRLFKVPVAGGLPQPLPLAHGETATLSASGQQLIYTAYRDFQEEAWKRYRGGRAPDLWYYDANTRESKRLTQDDAPDSWPMWAGNTVYFLSERGPEQRSNIWALDLPGGESRQLTHFADIDVRHPGHGDGSIVFEAGGRLYFLDPRTQQPREVVVTIEADRPEMAPTPVSVAERIEHVDLSGSGTDVVISARGDLFKLSREPELVINLTRTPGIAERYPTLAPDGRRLAFFSDESGEYQLIVRDLRSGEQRTLTRFTEGFRYKPQWSPNARKLTFIDSTQAIHVIDVQTGQDTVIDRDTVRDHFSLDAWRASWSPDSRWLAYVRAMPNRNLAVFLFDVTSGQTHQVTSGTFSDASAVFGPEGDYLYLLSYRALRPTYGDIDPTWTYAGSMGISVIPLRKSVRAPFEGGAAAVVRNEKQPSQPAGKPAAIAIDLDGFEQRLVSVPVAAGSLGNLTALPGRLLYARMDSSPPGRGTAVEILDLKTGGTSIVARDADEVLVGNAGEEALVRREREYFLFPAQASSPEAGSNERKLPVERMYALFDRRQENEQQFADAWRYVRDYFYDPRLHGIDWRAIRERYQPLVASASTDEDMSALLREIAGELSAGHVWAFANSDGRPPTWSDGKVGLLGVDFEVRDGGYRIARILDPGPNLNDVRSPLADPALGVRVGDYLVGVNGVPLTTDTDPFAAFENQVGTAVSLAINSRAGMQGSREVVVKTLTSEAKLRERVWVEENRARVARASGGRVGYIYVPDTGTNGQTDLMAQYRAHFDKQALIIDERFNRGGALGDRLVELLDRRSLNQFVTRNAATYSLPELSHDGPKVMLINGWSYSGGDGFPYLFKTARLGPIVGTRTWGGLIGPSLPLPLIGGGKISVANQRVRDMRGEWAEGNHGVLPDIQIDNDPSLLATGTDQQLEKAVATALEQLASKQLRSSAVSRQVEQE